jgi:diguanylate cyclase (GGDEF)-like protein
MPSPHRKPSLLRFLAALALAGLGLHAAHTGLGLGRGATLTPLIDEWLYNGLMLAAAVALLVRGIVRREDRAAWLVLGAGALAWSAGDLYFSLFLADDAVVPLPSVSDALFISWYPAAYVALALLVRRNVRGFHASLWVDAVLGALAVSAVASALLYDAARVGFAGEAPEIVATLAYPVGDVLLVALVVAVLALTAWRPGQTWGLIGAALALGALGDGVYLYESARGTYAEGTILDSVWPASLLLLAFAAWRPSRPLEPRLEGLRILAMPAVFAATAIAVFVVDQAEPLNPVAVGLACATIVALVVRMGFTLRENQRMVAASRGEALTDALTGLGNRRKLIADLERLIPRTSARDARILVLFDLDGFKRYNDSFGHLAGDALLARLGAKLSDAAAPHGQAYRLGGDEFCVVARTAPDHLEGLLDTTADALREHGEGFDVESSYGAVAIPHEATTPSTALQIADRRMYARKDGRPSAERLQTRDVLVRALQARGPGLGEGSMAELAAAVGRRMGMAGEALDEVARAAELHDVGKVAVPDAILEKADELTDDEWSFMRRHTILGERILNGADAMRPIARLVRSTHERFDGTGYPDGLQGEEIPLGARIVAVCDAFAAMTSDRPYRPAVPRARALEELRRAAGSQFDPRVVEAFVAELHERPGHPASDDPAGDDHAAYVREVAGRLRGAIGGT